MVRMIALDMDGTLLNAEGSVSARNLAAIQAAERAGIRVVIATGRRHCYAMRQLRGLGLAEDSVIVSSNGTVTRRLGAGAGLIARTHLPTETALWLCGHLAEFRNALVLTFDRVGPDGEDERGALVVEHLEDLHKSIDRWMVANTPYIEQSIPIEDALRGGAPIQMMVCGTVERMRRAEARLLELPGVSAVGLSLAAVKPGAKVALSRTEYPERDLSIVDILPAGVSKGAALAQLAEERGIAMSEVMAIGDNWNDLSMLQVAGYPVLMGNAPEELLLMARERGWTVTASNDEDGVAAAIRSVLPEGNQAAATAEMATSDAL